MKKLFDWKAATFVLWMMLWTTAVVFGAFGLMMMDWKSYMVVLLINLVFIGFRSVPDYLQREMDKP